jgi:hypothetical protein
VRLALDSAALPSGEREALEALIARARFFELPARHASAHPDAFQYDLAIEQEGRRHTICLGDRDAPADLKPLLERLVEIARSGRSPG